MATCMQANSIPSSMAAQEVMASCSVVMAHVGMAAACVVMATRLQVSSILSCISASKSGSSASSGGGVPGGVAGGVAT